MKSYGRKEIIQKGTAALATISISFFVCFLWKAHSNAFAPSLIIILGFIFFRMIFSATLGPVPWIYLPEIVEPDIVGISTMLNWLTAALISFIFPLIVAALGGPEWMFLILSLTMWISYFINDKLMVETKDKA